ncbi:amidohydrolase family protein [Maribacter confluentis]|uniref:Amidohydrolase family protein n=1 Tax=Maribacter confluentis TaxID=1656093 RepID=A0ABT8RJM9_9FLAO|nr:amidohydrolase family protein [Maribacter confluentis]MDO1511050.1 amidohydrolase family protein [Maribacter confluentis]
MSVEALTALVKDMDAMNEAIMVNLSGRSGESLKEKVDNINKSYPNRFVVFANVDFEGAKDLQWGKKAAAQLELDIKNGAKGLKIFKSLGLRNKDADGNRLAIDDYRLDPIWEKCAEMGVPVLIHAADPKSFWDEMNAENERWLELKTHPREKGLPRIRHLLNKLYRNSITFLKNIQRPSSLMLIWDGMPIIWKS